MNLGQARSLDAVARTGSFRSAAAELLVTQPAVSHHIATLERELGIALVARSSRGATLTAAGLVLLPRVRAFLAAEATTRAEAEVLRRRHGGLVRIAAVNNSLVDVLSPVVSQFIAAHPDHQVEVREESGVGVVRRLSEEGDDLGVFGALPDRAPHLPGLRVRVMGAITVGLFAPTGHPLLGRRTVGPEDVAAEPLITFRQGWALRDSADEYLRDTSVHVTCEVRSVEAARSLVAAGVGVALLPLEGGSGRMAGVRARALDPEPPPVHRILAEPDRPTRSAAVEIFADLLQAAMA